MRSYTTYECDDGSRFTSLHEAEAWDARLLTAAKATRLFREGGLSLMSALAVAGVEAHPRDRAALSMVTAETKLSIPHWQCRDQPGYLVEAIHPNGLLRVFGSAGSWSGPYGSSAVRPSEVARYYEQTVAYLARGEQS